MTTPYIVIESADAWRHAESQEPGLKTAVWATTSPYVAELLSKSDRAFHRLDGDIDQKMADTIGYFGLRTARSVAAEIDALATDWPDGTEAGSAIRSPMHRLFTNLAYKAFMLNRLQIYLGSRENMIVVGRRELAPVDQFSPMHGEFDTLFTAIGSQAGLRHIAFDVAAPVPSMGNGDYIRPNLWTRCLTVLSSPVSAPIFRIWLRLLRGRPVRLHPFGSCTTVFIDHANDLIEETFPNLLLRGARVAKCPPLTRSPIEENETTRMPVADIEEIVDCICQKQATAHGLEWSPEYAAIVTIAAQRIARALSIGRQIAEKVPTYCNYLVKLARGEPMALLTSHWPNTTETLLCQRLRAMNVPVYTAEHGGASGLTRLFEALADSRMNPFVHRGIYYHEGSKKFEERAIREADGEGLIAGAPMIGRRILARRLQRFSQRLWLGTHGREIFWIPAFYPNNMQFLPHYWRDSAYFDFCKSMVGNVLGRQPDRVSIKLYPTFRYVDPDPLASIFRLPDNCNVIQFIDFRNLRAAADVIVIDNPGSVLALTFSANVPQIYVETGMNPLNEDVANAFRDGLFYVDARVVGWENELLHLLHLPHAELVKAYEKKTVARQSACERFVHGPPGQPGARVAKFILDAPIEVDESPTKPLRTSGVPVELNGG